MFDSPAERGHMKSQIDLLTRLLTSTITYGSIVGSGPVPADSTKAAQ